MPTPRFALVLAGALAVGALTALPAPIASAADPKPESRQDAVLSSRLQEVNAEPEVTTREVADETSTPPDGPGSLLRYDDQRYLAPDHDPQVLARGGVVLVAEHLDRLLSAARIPRG